MARRIFTILALVLALNLSIPIVNAISPFSPSYTSQASNDLNSAKIINAVGCVPTSLNGVVSSATSSSVTDSSQIWSANQWTGSTITITSGPDSGDTKVIASNTQTKITISGTWATTPGKANTFTITGASGGSAYSCSASVGGSVGQNSILGGIVNTILVFGNFFAAASFLVQLAAGVVVPGYYVQQWTSAACSPLDYQCLNIANLFAVLLQSVVWLAYADGIFYVISGRDILG